jgi:aldose 1-epimerase
MKVTKQKMELPGKDSGVSFFLLEHDSGASARISNFGAIIGSLFVRDRNGLFRDVVLGFNDLKEYTGTVYRGAYPYFGALIGRYANRIKNGHFQLNNREYQLPQNLGNDTLHGGMEGFDSKVWTVLDYGHQPEPYIVLSYLSADGEEGFPGNLSVTVTYELNKNGLSWKLEAHTDAPTIFNPAQHTYFNLDGGAGKIETHRVKIYGSQYMEQDEWLNATGRLLPVQNTPLDFTNLKTVNTNWNPEQGYDQSYIIDNYNGSLQLAAETTNADGSLCLQVYTEPVVHFYTGRWIPAVKGKYNDLYGPYSGLCFETQHHPNAINLNGFPDTLLKPGEQFLRNDRFLFF